MIKIQVLDYKYSDTASNQFNLNNVSAPQQVDIESGTPDTEASWKSIEKTSVTYDGGAAALEYYEDVATGLTSGYTYRFTLNISGYAGTGTCGFSAQGGLGAEATRTLSADGTITGEK